MTSTPGTSPAPALSLPSRVPSTPLTLADEVVAAVLKVPGVADLHGGAFGEAATYLPGRKVVGVRLRDDEASEVHVVLQFGAPVMATAHAVRQASGRVTGGAVDVWVQDVVGAPPPPGHVLDTTATPPARRVQ